MLNFFYSIPRVGLVSLLGVFLWTSKANSASLAIDTIIRGNISPKSIVHSGEGLFFAQNMMYRHTVTVYDRKFRLITTIPDAIRPQRYGWHMANPASTWRGAPVEAAFSDQGKYAWVSNYRMYGAEFRGSGTDNCKMSRQYDQSFLYKINTQSFDIEKVVQVGCVPKYVAVSPDNCLILASNWCSGDISIIDADQAREIKRIVVGAHPRGIAITQKSDYAYIAVMGSYHIAVLNLHDFSLSWLKNIGRTPRHLCLSPDDRYLYASLNGEGNIAKIDLLNNEIVTKTYTGKAPRSMVLSGDGAQLYVVNYLDNTLAHLNTADMTLQNTLPTPPKPIGIAYDEDLGKVWVACYSGSILVLSDTDFSANASQLARNNLPSNSTPSTPKLPFLEQKMQAQLLPYFHKHLDLSRIEQLNLQYDVIVGSFSNSVQANKHAQSMSRKYGFAVRVLPASEGKYRISAGHFTQNQAAENALADARRRLHPQAWLLVAEH